MKLIYQNVPIVYCTIIYQYPCMHIKVGFINYYFVKDCKSADYFLQYPIDSEKLWCPSQDLMTKIGTVAMLVLSNHFYRLQD